MSRLWRLICFALVGGSGVVVNLGVFQACYLAALGLIGQSEAHTIANVAGVVVSIFTNFLLNDRYTWGDRVKGGRGHWAGRLGRYYLVCGVAALVQLGVGRAAFELWLIDTPLSLAGHNLSPGIAVLLGIAAGILINFPVSHYWAFRDASTSAAPDHP